MSGAPAFKAGWLSKKSGGKEGKKSVGNMYTHFDKRYFVLDDGHLSYYKKERDREPAGRIQMVGASIERSHHNPDTKFHVTSKGDLRKLTLAAPSAAECESWLAALHQALAQNQHLKQAQEQLES